MRTEIITIGDELLIGQTADTNAQTMARILSEAGFEVQRITSVPDRIGDIVNTLGEASGRSDLVMVTGGLGPTADDVTRQAITRFFHTDWEMNSKVYERMREYLSRRGRKISGLNKEQAMTPVNGKVFINHTGTAPGIGLQKNATRFFFMPGVPDEMHDLLRQAIMPDINSWLQEESFFHQNLVTQGIPEAHLAQKLKSFEANLPENMKLAYLPQGGLVKLRLSARGQEKSLLQQHLKEKTGVLKQLISGYLVYTGDQSPEEYVGELLIKTHATVSTAESCTGGMIAARITSVAGSSAYFKGSVVAYADEIKIRFLQIPQDTLEQHGAVSRQVVEEMAGAVQRLHRSDYALAVSGIAGPGGGTPGKPVGTTWIAVAGPEKIHSRQFFFGTNRHLNIRKTVNTALVMLKRMISDEF
jgi:nicotinamide-nucleotide amidase